MPIIATPARAAQMLREIAAENRAPIESWENEGGSIAPPDAARWARDRMTRWMSTRMTTMFPDRTPYHDPRGVF